VLFSVATKYPPDHQTDITGRLIVVKPRNQRSGRVKSVKPVQLPGTAFTVDENQNVATIATFYIG